jgi:transposase InsO family protein
LEKIIGRVGISRRKFLDWHNRYGRANEDNGLAPRDHWLEDYRRLTGIMVDRDVVAASRSTVYRLLARVGRLSRWNHKPSKKNTGFVQPLAPHGHWHIDISYPNIASTFFCLCAALDGASGAVIHWDLRESMRETDVEMILEVRARSSPAWGRASSETTVRRSSRDFKEYIRFTGMTHVRTAPLVPPLQREDRALVRDDQGRWHPPRCSPGSRGGLRVLGGHVEYYNSARLHSAMGYITPNDFLAGRREAIWAARDEKLVRTRELRNVSTTLRQVPVAGDVPRPRLVGSPGDELGLGVVEVAQLVAPLGDLVVDGHDAVHAAWRAEVAALPEQRGVDPNRAAVAGAF